ncbi:MAG: GHKL domain-containing protein [Gammaproteobacteria bacterium AqS3]|nr:GHKL domain-containing protein [Gammaproteobacteria bacterium AqS3]
MSFSGSLHSLISFLLAGLLGAGAGLLIGWGAPTGAGLGWGVLAALTLWRLRQLRRYVAHQIDAPEGLKISGSELGQIVRQLSAERTRQADSLEQLDARLEQFNQALRTISTGLMILGPEARVVTYNASAKRLLNLQRLDLGRPLYMLLRQPSTFEWLRSGEAGSHQFTSPDGVEIMLRRSPQIEGSGETVLEAVDCSEAAAQEQERRRLIADMAHELNTPLTVLRGYLEPLLDEAPKGSDARKMYRSMLRQCERLRLLSGALPELLGPPPELNPDEEHSAQAAEIVRQCIADLGSQVKVQIQVDVDEDLQIPCTSDALYTVLGNLIGNAVKYTQKDGSIRISAETEAGGSVRVEVHDTGRGIERRDIPHLTERFYRSGPRSGMGLGLAIVDRILKQYGAQLEIDSEVGAGSTFACRFPPPAESVEAVGAGRPLERTETTAFRSD